jgi:hypothetical protein
MWTPMSAYFKRNEAWTPVFGVLIRAVGSEQSAVVGGASCWIFDYFSDESSVRFGVTACLTTCTSLHQHLLEPTILYEQIGYAIADVMAKAGFDVLTWALVSEISRKRE